MGARIHSYRRVKRYNKEAVKKAIAYHGPATISINANPKTLKFYSHGVLDDITCSKWNSFLVGLKRLGGGKKLPFECDEDGRRKIWLKPLKETDLGVAKAFFDL